MNRIIIIISLSLVLLAGLSACRKELPELNPSNKYIIADYNAVFNAFWNGMNNNYVFWDIDTTNWDNMYKIYQPLFAQLNGLSADTAGPRVYSYFKAMTDGLIDGHYFANLPGGLGWYNMSLSPSYDQRRKEGRYHQNYPALVSTVSNIYSSYLVPALSTWGWVSPAKGDTLAVLSGYIKPAKGQVDSIAYLRFNKFRLAQQYSSPYIKAALTNFFDHVKNKQTSGLIIDLRGNQGGYLADMHFLVGNLITEPLHWGYSKYKNGSGRLDYTPWIKNIVTPQTGSVAFDKPIVVLIDGNTISMGEMTTLALKALPAGKTTIIGERSWGGLGGLTDYDFPSYSGGMFTFGTGPYGKIYTPNGQTCDLNKINYEGRGITPAIVVNNDSTSMTGITDAPLDRAIAYLRSHP
ncbi:MAG TPA: S41 family peptidase [Chitinophaga sp.]|uniref:S41 family peptidase n=1 Tax=Chitinophaga sp. TaxID=1869181 RepID=UPI002BC9DE2C|nr:S41 family peptidase [Chitinophaga sp.]HVI45136.1 S41 family peptidase [Chitinophaga sp.]